MPHRNRTLEGPDATSVDEIVTLFPCDACGTLK